MGDGLGRKRRVLRLVLVDEFVEDVGLFLSGLHGLVEELSHAVATRLWPFFAFPLFPYLFLVSKVLL